MLNYARLCYNYANYALCSDCVIMPKSNAGIIGLAQVTQRLSSQSYQPGHLTQVGVCTSGPQLAGLCGRTAEGHLFSLVGPIVRS